jgi:prefoldin subunit 5
MEPATYQLIGIIVQTVLFLLAGYGMVIKNDASVNSLKTEVKEIQKEIKEMANVITQLAVQAVRLDNIGERLNALDRKFEELRRGPES